jgi:uncharacterized protein
MSADSLVFLSLGVFVVACLYSSVGHAGASGYIAVMSLLSIAPDTIKPAALTLNILVASIGTWQFWRAGHFRWQLFWPFALLSAPLAFLGGYLALPSALFQLLLGGVLLYAAAQCLLQPRVEPVPRAAPTLVSLASGGGIGLLSGLTGTGGGIFLTPLMLFMRWSGIKTAAAVSALFILLNSVAGLLGNVSSRQTFPAFVLILVVAAAAGGMLGAHYGSRHLEPAWVKRCLALVLGIAGTKLLLLS